MRPPGAWARKRRRCGGRGPPRSLWQRTPPSAHLAIAGAAMRVAPCLAQGRGARWTMLGVYIPELVSPKVATVADADRYRAAATRGLGWHMHEEVIWVSASRHTFLNRAANPCASSALFCI